MSKKEEAHYELCMEHQESVVVALGSNTMRNGMEYVYMLVMSCGHVYRAFDPHFSHALKLSMRLLL